MDRLTITQSDLDALWHESWHAALAPDPKDPDDVLLKMPTELGLGFRREVYWEEELHLAIDRFQPERDLHQQFDEWPHPIEMGFLLAGCCEVRGDQVSAGMNWFCGSGCSPVNPLLDPAVHLLRVDIHLSPQLYASMLSPEGEIPAHLDHLFRDPETAYHYRFGTTTPEMQVALRQILRCPYQGNTKRMYLESKILELLALMTAQEEERFAPTMTPPSFDEVDRIYAARNLLIERLQHPPSLLELARLVGLNDNALKRGFRQVFDTTVFGFLHHHRLEQAQQFLASGELRVTEVAALVGFESRSHFSSAFRKKFGINPKDYQMQLRKSG
jgi:AraC family transcriptional regulator, transcriptional activator of the genes for pyochelin and ferripyochelin receptors